MRIISNNNYKERCEAHDGTYQIFKVHNANLNDIKALFEKFDAEDKKRALELRLTNMPEVTEQVENLEKGYTIFDVLEQDDFIQFATTCGDYPEYSELIYGITREIDGSFGYGETIIKDNRKYTSNPSITYAAAGYNITGKEYYKMANDI